MYFSEKYEHIFTVKVYVDAPLKPLLVVFFLLSLASRQPSRPIHLYKSYSLVLPADVDVIHDDNTKHNHYILRMHY
jgi:hypothetical protein